MISPKQKPPIQYQSAAANQLCLRFEDSTETFFVQFLEFVSEAPKFVAGQVWGLNEFGQLVKIASTNAELFQRFERAEVVNQHRRLLSDALSKNEPIEIADGVDQKSSRKNVIYVHQICLDRKSVGLVELILDGRLDERAKFQLSELVDVAERYLAKNSVPKTSLPTTGENRIADSEFDELHGSNIGTERNRRGPIPVPFEQVEELVLLLHNMDDWDYVASTTVSELRRILECDRVALVVAKGSRVEIAAISGVDSINHRSDAIQQLKGLARLAMDRGKAIRSDKEQTLDADSENLLVDYVQASRAHWVCAHPVFEPLPVDQDSDFHQTDQSAFGCLVLENFSNKAEPEEPNITRLSVHCSQALYHCLAHEQLLFVPVRRRLGQFAKLAKLTRAKILLASSLVAVMVLALFFVETPYFVNVTGKMVPDRQFRAYAPFDGVVKEIFVGSEQAVKPGQLLASVFGDSLTARTLTMQNESDEKRKLLKALKTQYSSSGNISDDERTTLSARIAQYEIEIEGLIDRIEIADRLLAKSEILTPIRGTVATFQPNELLTGRPITRGDLLLEIMDEDGPWRLELEVPESRLGHLLDLDRQKVIGKEITYIVATAPNVTGKAKISKLDNQVVLHDKGSANLQIHAMPEDDPAIQKTINAKVNAKINCGNKRLGYVLFGDIFEWFSKNFF